MANQRTRLDDEAARAGAADQTGDGVKFEEQLENLESIVTRIDSGELSLEESIDAFEHGVKLVRSLNHKLDEVERRVEVLTRGNTPATPPTPTDNAAKCDGTTFR